MTVLWCYIEGQSDGFSVSIPSSHNIDKLKKQIYDEQVKFIFKCGSGRLTLTKVDVDYSEAWEKINAGEYRPTSNDQELEPIQIVSQVWPEPPPGNHLHIFVGLPRASGVVNPNIPTQTAAWHKAATNLHQVMWRNDLGEKLHTVTGLTYLSSSEVTNLQLKKLGCDVDAFLFREEYSLVIKRLEAYRPKMGGVVVLGHPGIGKSVFLFYMLLHLLSIGEPVALQHGNCFYLFSQNGVKMYDGETTGWDFHFKGKLWALSDSSNLHTIEPCQAFQQFSLRGHAFIVQATSLAGGQWKGWRKQCKAGIFIMDSFTQREAKALSTILNLHVESFLGYFKKWGPSAYTCVGLVQGYLSEGELNMNATIAADKFARDPTAIILEAPSQDDSHVLFTVTPIDDERWGYTLRVSTPYLSGLVMEKIAKFDAADQVSFYRRVNGLPQFKGTWEYMFKKYFIVWLYSAEWTDELPCTAKYKTATRSMTTAGDQAELSLKPLGQEKLTVTNGYSNFANAKDSNTPFGWLPASRTLPSFDAVICTDINIITIQLIVSSKHAIIKPDGFDRLNQYLPVTFERARTWCHVFVTDCPENADALRRQHYDVADEKNVSIYSAVLDVSKCNFSSEDVERAFTPSVTDESVAMDTSGMEVVAEEEQQMTM